MRTIKGAFIGANGKLCPIWRALLFVVASYFVLPPILDWLFLQAAQWLHLSPSLSPGAIDRASSARALARRTSHVASRMMLASNRTMLDLTFGAITDQPAMSSFLDWIHARAV